MYLKISTNLMYLKISISYLRPEDTSPLGKNLLQCPMQSIRKAILGFAKRHPELISVLDLQKLRSRQSSSKGPVHVNPHGCEIVRIRALLQHTACCSCQDSEQLDI